MARTTRGEWAKRVEQWGASGLTAWAFAEKAGVNQHSLTHWKWRLAKEARASETPRAVGFVEVPTPASVEPLEVVLHGGRRIRVPPRFEPDTLRRLLEILEER